MMGMHMAWMLLPPITIVLAVVAIILAARGPQKTVASDHRSRRRRICRRPERAGGVDRFSVVVTFPGDGQ